MTCTLRSVYDTSLFEKYLSYHSDGYFNKHSFLFNSNPKDIWFPESVKYRFNHGIDSITTTLDQMNQDLTIQSKSFFDAETELDPIFLWGKNYIDRLRIDKDTLAHKLQQETDEGRFFKSIENETFKNLIKNLSEVWIFSNEDYQKDYSLEDKKYYFAFNLLYCYINQGRKKAIRNTIYINQ